MEIDIIIDSLTDCLVCTETGDEFDTEFGLVSKTISKSEADELKKQGWQFDWSIPHAKGYEIYELRLVDDDVIQGLIALKHFRNQYYTHVDIVESAPSNLGSKGKYTGVGAHLFAIACKLSWDVGNEGYVQFVSKTDLIDHYKRELKAKHIDGNTLYIDSYAAVDLINKYLKVGE